MSNREDLFNLDEDFFNACQSGSKSIVELHLENPILDPNQRKNAYQPSPIEIACQNNHLDVIRMLIKDSRIDPNIRNCGRVTILHMACQDSKLEIIKILLEHPRLDLNSVSNSKTPLHLASSYNLIPVMKLLLADPRIDVNYKNFLIINCWTPLHYACNNGHLEAFKLLISHPQINIFNLSDFGSSVLHFANDKDICKIILEETSIDPNSQNDFGKIPLVTLTESYTASIESIKLLLEDSRVDPTIPTYDGSTVLSTACKLNNFLCVKLFLENDKININTTDRLKMTPFEYACMNSSFEIIRMFLEDPRLDIEKNCDRSFYYACGNANKDNAKTIQMLLEDHRFKIEKYDKLNVDLTSFKSACLRGNYDVIKLLLDDPRINPDIYLDNVPILHSYCLKNNKEMVKLFLNKALDRIVIPDLEISKPFSEEIRNLLDRYRSQ